MTKSNDLPFTRRHLGKLALAGPLTATLNALGQTGSSSPKVLEVTFQGPFVCRLLASSVRIYAPICKQHEAYIQTDQERVLLYDTASSSATGQGFECKLGVPMPSPTQSDCQNPTEMILVDWARVQNPNGPSLSACAWQIEMPRPDLIRGLAIESFGYTPADLSSSQPVCGRFATAIRLYYVALTSMKGVKLTRTNLVKPIIDMSSYPDPPEIQPSVPIVFRYSPKKPSNNLHSDAIYGFEQMRKLLPPLNRWSVQNCDMHATPFAMLSHAGDCGAPLIVLAAQADLQYWQQAPKK